MTTQVQSAKTQQGFSLIELLVVVAIIGVLAAAGVVGYTSYLDNVKADTHRNNTLAIGKALSLNAVAKNGNLTVNPDTCSATSVDLALAAGATDQTVKHDAMLACIRRIALEAKFKSPFAGAGLVTQTTIDDYIVEAPDANRNVAFSTGTLPHSACDANTNANKGKILVHHHDVGNLNRMQTTIFACDTPKAGLTSVIIPDSIVQVDYLN